MRHLTTALCALAVALGCTPLRAQQSAPFRNAFPSQLSVAHTWNRSLAKKAGKMIGWQLAREGVAQVALPNLTVVTAGDATANLLDTYGQSPYLTAETGVEMVKGLQTDGQLKAYIHIDEKEKDAPYVRPWQRALDEAHAAGLATAAQIEATSACGKSLPDEEEFRRTALQVAHESITLLRNAGSVLPVDTAWVKQVAATGDNALVNDMLPALRKALPCTVTSAPAQADLILLFEDDEIDQARARQMLLTGKPVVLVLLNSRPVELGEAARCAAIVEAWHPGREGMQAIADVLTGAYNPGGKLAVAIPGYAFGHGLSYSDFLYTDLRIEPEVIGTDGSVSVRFNVTNVSSRPGAEVVQVYLYDEESSTPLMEPKLEACKRTNLNAGQTKEVKFTIRRRNMELLGTDGRFAVEPGRFTVRIGSSSDDIRLQKDFEVK